MITLNYFEEVNVEYWPVIFKHLLPTNELSAVEIERVIDTLLKLIKEYNGYYPQLASV